MSGQSPLFTVGQRVFFWSGRGSQGYGTIRMIKGDRALIDPEPEAIKGSDFRHYPPGSPKKDSWWPRDYGVRVENLNIEPNPWYKND